MDAFTETPDDLGLAARRVLLAFSAATLGAMALPGLLDGTPTGRLLALAAALIATSALPIRDAALRRRIVTLAAITGFATWVVVLPFFHREGMVVPVAMALACAAAVRGVVADASPAVQADDEATPAEPGWIEEDGRRIPW